MLFYDFSVQNFNPELISTNLLKPKSWGPLNHSIDGLGHI